MKQITAKQYVKIHPFLPVQRGNLRTLNITFINAVLYVLENGCKRRALPERFGKWKTVYAQFRRWSRSGVLERLFAALREQEAAGGDANCFGLDSASAEVHPDGTGARKTNGPQSIGKSRGGWYAKIHMVSASGRHAMIFRLSGGQANDAPEALSGPGGPAQAGLHRRDLHEDRHVAQARLGLQGTKGSRLGPFGHRGPSAFIAALRQDRIDAP